MYNQNVPSHLPDKLTITLWDFCWYTMTMPGEPFDDLDRAFAEAVERGYNTIRICAMPMFIFKNSKLRDGKLKFSNLGEGLGHRTRWFNCQGGAELNALEHLENLFKMAQKHNCFVILSSWEYQQSPAFLETNEIYKELMSIQPEERFHALANSMIQLVTHLKHKGLADRIAYAELHNEVEYGKLTEVLRNENFGDQELTNQINEQTYKGMRSFFENAITQFKELHPDILFTIGYSLARPKVSYWNYIAENMDVAHFHLYNDGVLKALYDEVFQEPFPNQTARSMLREDAPPFEKYSLDEKGGWRFKVFPVKTSNFYMFDWCDPVKWDLWLYEHYSDHREAMRLAISHKFDMYSEWAQKRNLPMVIGEGYVGYTPAETTFEEGPVGKDIAKFAIEKALDKGAWGMVLSSICAPHHHFWNDIEWQQKMNRKILDSNKLDK
ncbi:cellulase-like family protein [Gracilibacillus alcaliphilus]|uniref:cellulase-like family protein n=1 Tax=Gracilibacillus alcaliphilus TaxID=1401441 RepID=UPI001959D682|nr:cellulase-like family protein [Gracilibacillus alcaliphilus]MBM7677736.1 hypothetical protein [Gracilibacillus alcaliphilus]